jgi:YesN/AraC family two-component response regulator
MDPNLFPVDAYLSKPVTREKLLEVLKSLIPAERQ